MIFLNSRLVGPLAVARRVRWNRACPSFCCSVQKFSCNWLLSFFLNLPWCWGSMWCVWKPDFLKKYFCLQNGKIGPKIVFFFNILENLVIERCIRYIFASLFCMSKTQQFKKKENCFLFHFENSFNSWYILSNFNF